MTVSVHPHTPRIAVPCGCELGEEATWDARSGTLVWVDVEKPTIWRYDPASGATQHHPQDEKLGFALLTEDPETLLAGFESGIALLHLESGRRRPLITPDAPRSGNRLNSGYVGPDGALYFGTMDDAEAEPTGTFHRWHGGRLDASGGRVVVSNGPVVTPDGRRIYTADTTEGLIRVHRVDDDGIGPPRPFAVFESGWGKPDGLTVDAAGHLWVCHYGGSRITRYDPDGQIERVLPVPTALVTKCAFGGPDLTTLFITTGTRGRDPRIDPMAGHLFAVETEVAGLPSGIYRDARTL
ncbi:gluconolaconase [Methylobacterium sp. Leaf104]|uniref:SMP-30/gluconolactonase/LRE family protein n=1 Tax=Methylobacterium TaxID=407 RepID=UPI0006F65BF7|nr:MULTISPECIES: SMP-30/gluconolactonase/LRE family protein [Methylobacterium]KQP33556.1 gluconolaconase [Methylobacterium sp. Leaf104]MCI9879917.1 SMP-30/gluconolactonase/LRE family protein [Methylobacterium goesingense]